MTIYPDASFLVSWLYKPDPLNAKARVWFAKHQGDDFLISDWSRFETITTLRDLCLRPHPPKQELIEALRRYFSHLLQAGPFEFAAVDWDEVLQDAHQISAGFAARLKARSADALHVAILEQISPDLFVSGDKDQLALATARGFSAERFYA
jgi:predicted nucleic acid-binding protein